MVVKRNRIQPVLFMSILTLLILSSVHVYSQMTKTVVAIVSGIESGSPLVKPEGKGNPVELKVGMNLFADSVLYSKTKSSRITILLLKDTSIHTRELTNKEVSLSLLTKKEEVSKPKPVASADSQGRNLFTILSSLNLNIFYKVSRSSGCC